MELCISRAISNLPHQKLLSPNPSRFQSRKYLPLNKGAAISHGSTRVLLYTGSHLVRATTSEETSTSVYEQSDAATAPKKEIKEASNGVQVPLLEFLEKFNIKLDFEDNYSTTLIYGTGALFVLWIASAVVRAIDSIPLFPKALELVGLGYSVWFSYRYLIFKESRKELVNKIEELKEQVIGDE